MKNILKIIISVFIISILIIVFFIIIGGMKNTPDKTLRDQFENTTTDLKNIGGMKNTPDKTLRDQFKNTTTDLKNIGGIMCNNFGTQWFYSMLKDGDVNLNNTSVCASVNRGTCTAWTLLRKDLLPMPFMYPGVESSVPCGILLDPKIVWPMITLMAVIDGDTNSRSCCTNETGDPILTRSPWLGTDSSMCIYNSMVKQVKEGKLDSKFIEKNYAVYIPKIDKGCTGGSCKTSCNGDKTCMYNNSGGNINQWLMNASKQCINGDYADCYTFKEIDESLVPNLMKQQIVYNQPVGKQVDGWLVQGMNADCLICKKPYLCVFKDAPEIPTGSTVSNVMPDHKVLELQSVALAASENRNRFLKYTRENFTPSSDKYKIIEGPDQISTYIGEDGRGYQNIISEGMNIGPMAIKQCRFERDNWNMWIKVLKQYYRDLLGLVRYDNSMVESFNYMLANPAQPSYFEHEVNMYIDPDTTTDEYKTQNKTFQDAIIGFYYTEPLCEEQLAPLEGVVSTSGDVTVSGTIDRCNMFYNMTTDVRRKWEENRREESKQLVHKVADMFNKKHNKNIKVYKCTASSNSFPNYNVLNATLNGDNKFDDLFQIDK